MSVTAHPLRLATVSREHQAFTGSFWSPYPLAVRPSYLSYRLLSLKLKICPVSSLLMLVKIHNSLIISDAFEGEVWEPALIVD